MIQSLVFLGLIILAHGFIVFSIALENHLMHIVILTNGLIEHGALAADSKSIDPVVLGLSEHLPRVKF